MTDAAFIEAARMLSGRKALVTGAASSIGAIVNIVGSTIFVDGGMTLYPRFA